MSMANLAGFAGASLGLFLGLPLAGELERLVPKPILWRFSLWKKSMTAPDGFRSVLNLRSTAGGTSSTLIAFDGFAELREARMPVGIGIVDLVGGVKWDGK